MLIIVQLIIVLIKFHKFTEEGIRVMLYKYKAKNSVHYLHIY